MIKKDNSDLYATYHYKCSKCETTYPDDKVAKCFVCGEAGTVSYSRADPKKRKKKKNLIRGAGFKINV